MNAVIYARVSSREQEQEGYSIPAQQKMLREYAFKNGFEIVKEFVDVETAKTPGRKAFGEMVEFLENPRNSRVVLVEKTDRLYRNFRDAVTLEDVNAEIHFLKEGQVISKNSRSQDKLAHGLHLLIARNYVENLREEVKKGMREKAEQGIYPGRAPFGYRNNRTDRTIEIHPTKSEIVKRAFELYATSQHTLSSLRKKIREEFGLIINRAYLHTVLTNTVYVGIFQWGGQTYRGKHDTFISQQLFDNVQAVIRGHHKGKYRKHDIAFRGMLTCAHDDCTITAELKKGKYVYYRCSGYRGKCELPRFTEEELSEKLGELLKRIHIPDDVLKSIEGSLQRDRLRLRSEAEKQRESLQGRLNSIRRRMDQAYTDKLDGRIPEDFWQRKMSEWQQEAQRIEMAIAGLNDGASSDRLLDAQRILELANKAYFLYVTRKPAEQAELLKKVLLNCSIDGASVYPTYRKPFDMIFERAKKEEWSGREDLNLRPPGPEDGIRESR